KNAEVKWLTTWCDKAPDLVAPLCNFPAYEVIDYRELDFGYKTEGLVNELVVNGPRPFIWIDDEAASPREVNHLKARLEVEGVEVPPYLIIEPLPRQGLTKEYIDMISYFVNTHSKEDGTNNV